MPATPDALHPDHDIIDRMGDDFSTEDFAPAIKTARDTGQKYEQIRDSIRKEWEPAGP